MCTLVVGALTTTLRFQRRVKTGGASSLLGSGDLSGFSKQEKKDRGLTVSI